MTPSVQTATAELECDRCGLNIHVGDDVVLGYFGWVHPVCGVAA